MMKIIVIIRTAVGSNLIKDNKDYKKINNFIGVSLIYISII